MKIEVEWMIKFQEKITEEVLSKGYGVEIAYDVCHLFFSSSLVKDNIKEAYLACGEESRL
jgi:hypothetical protein